MTNRIRSSVEIARYDAPAFDRVVKDNTAAQTPLPPSSPAHPRRSPSVLRNDRPSPSPLRRSASSMSLDRYSSTPALARRTSSSSLRGGLDSPTSLHSPKLNNRRSSSNLLLSQLMPALEEPAPITAETIATDHFSQELATHADPNQETDCKTVVIIHDDCYGHRFSRLNTKNTILSIFERPERLQAGVMGIAAAYVRLGERHAGGRHAPHPRKGPTTDIPFRILKSSRKVPLHSDVVTAVHGKELMKELQGMCDTTAQKIAAAAVEILRPPVNGKSKDQFHSGDLYLSEDSIRAFEGALGGVCDAVDAVFQGTASGKGPSQAFACVRPPGHHCSSDWPSGFCWLNNVHVGIQHAIQNHGLTHAAIIDFDLHHGDGSQEITWGHNERMQFPKAKNFPNSKKSFLGYFSLHDINSFPCELGDREKTQMASLCVDNAHGQAIWNVHLQKWQQPEEFWHLYETQYKVILEKTRNFLRHRTQELRTGKNQPAPKAAIFISAGFDASEHEIGDMQRHSVKVLTEFYARITRDIVELANEEGTAVDGRVISVLEGGYSDKALVSGVLSHISGLCDNDVISVKQEETNGFGQEKVGLSGLTPAYSVPTQTLMKYNTEWWESSNLDELVDLLHPAPSGEKAAPKKSRFATYSSPTHASAMKIVDHTKVYRSTSFNSRAPSVATSRAASPPPPDVDWATAASELCRLLVPQNRQIGSCTQAELNPKDIRVKKEKSAEPTAPMAAPTTNGRALRQRQPRVSNAVDTSRKASADRRRTIADVPLPSIEDMPKEPRRRTSIASTTSMASTVTAAPRARSTKPAGTGLDIKKSRPAPSTSRAPSVKPPPVPRIPSGLIKRSNSSRASSASVPPMEEKKQTTGANDDMDNLVSGLKRITIKVPSQQEYSSRQKKSPSAAPEKATSAGAKPTFIKKTVTSRPAAPGTAAAKRVPLRERAKAKAETEKAKVPATGPIKTVPIKAEEVTLAPAPTPAPNPVVEPIPVAPPSRDAMDIVNDPPAQPEPMPISTTHSPDQPYSTIQWAQPNADIEQSTPAQQFPPNPYSNGLHWMPPNAETTTTQPSKPLKPSEVAKMQKVMPTFSATGHIPFAGNGAASTNGEQQDLEMK
ncbi:Arginase/deacetylase [Microthyrium microscopicum]|uniref:Arginase/deacetylase n=1 Tax=Microthyrium microscopicum TaxID=703497 RepID=A0A6A6U2E4_9PEZI|nr:Arginase/deacetylase [Microthyrium microscopicum]